MFTRPGATARFITTIGGGGDVAAVIQAYTASVDSGGDGDYLTLAAAEAELTAPFSIRVKSGTYAGATLAKNAVWEFDPACVLTSQLDVDTAKVAIIAGPGFDTDTNNALIQWTAADGYLLFMNGCPLDSLELSGARTSMFGGGLGTTVKPDAGDAINVDAADISLFNFAMNSKANVASDDIDIGATTASPRASMSGIQFTDSDLRGVQVTDGDDSLIIGCHVLDSDNTPYQADGSVRVRMIGNRATNTGTNGINFQSTSPDGVAVANIIQVGAHDPINMDTNSSNVVAVGNRADGAIVDGSTGGSGTVDANDETAF